MVKDSKTAKQFKAWRSSLQKEIKLQMLEQQASFLAALKELQEGKRHRRKSKTRRRNVHEGVQDRNPAQGAGERSVDEPTDEVDEDEIIEDEEIVEDEDIHEDEESLGEDGDESENNQKNSEEDSEYEVHGGNLPETKSSVALRCSCGHVTPYPAQHQSQEVTLEYLVVWN